MGLFKNRELEEARTEIAKLKSENQALQAENEKLKTELNQIKKALQPNKVIEKSAEKPVVFNGITLTKEQRDVVDLLENTNRNYFITGKAGTGKSTVLNYFKANTKKKNIAVVSLTGAAAINVDGQTIHSLFRMDLEPQDTYTKAKVKTDSSVLDTLSSIQVLIIDEVSMVRADIMDMMDARLRLAKNKDFPFGGCQVIAFGDLFQLPPIATDRTEREFITNRYGTLFFFGAPAVIQTFQTIELKEVLRQKDTTFVGILNEVRDGTINESNVKFLNENSGSQTYPDDCLRIVLTKDMAKKINIEKLEKINAKERFYETELGGNNPPNKEDVPFDFELRLKVGAKVMMTRNDTAKRYINGSIGIITKLSNDTIQVEINGKKYDVEKAVWTKKIYRKIGNQLESEIVGWATQFPVRLAYAITVHKSQGQTYDEIVIDYSNGKAFAPGQTYVALSRCRTLKGIHLTRPLTLKDIYADKEVLEFMKAKLSSVSASQQTESIMTSEEYKLLAWLEDADNLPF